MSKKKNLSLYPLLLILAGVIGFLFAICLFFKETIFLDMPSIVNVAPDKISIKSFLLHHPATEVWLFFQCFRTSFDFIIAPVAGFYFIKYAQPLFKNFKNTWLLTGFSVLIVFILGFVILEYIIGEPVTDSLRDKIEFLNPLYKFKIVSKMGACISVVTMLTLMLGGIAAGSKQGDVTFISNVTVDVDILLYMTSGVIALSVLTNSLLREAIIAMNNPETVYPFKHVLITGLTNSFAIGLIYIPVRVMLYASAPKEHSPGEKKQQLSKKDISDILTPQLKVLFSILAPIISSILPSYLHL